MLNPRFLLSTFLLLSLLSFRGHEAWLFGGGSVEEEAPAGSEEDDVKDKVEDPSVGGGRPTVETPAEPAAEILSAEDEEDEEDALSFKNAAEELEHLNKIPHPHAEKLGDNHYHEGEHNADFDHQAILGTREEANEYNSLSPEEAKERLGKLVDKMDANGDGFVSHEELQKWITNSFLSLNEEESKDRFKEHDQDGNGKLTWDEYLISVYGGERSRVESTFAQNFMKLLREAFARIHLIMSNLFWPLLHETPHKKYRSGTMVK